MVTKFAMVKREKLFCVFCYRKKTMKQRITAYWISPTGDIYPVEKTHIQAVAENPELYGTTFEKVKSEYDKYGEVLPFQEHKARRNILTKIIKNGWIRMRLHLRSGTWTAETWEWGKREIEALQSCKSFMEENENFSLLKCINPQNNQIITNIILGF